MLKIVLATLLTRDAVIKYQDGTTSPSRINYGFVKVAYATVAGELFPKRLVMKGNVAPFADLMTCRPQWIVLKEEYSKEYKSSDSVAFVGTLAACGKYLEQAAKESIASPEMEDEFGSIVQKKDKPASPTHASSDTDEEIC